jgi:hypothetical protein
MGLRGWIYRLLDRGEVPQPDGDTIVEVADVPLWQGPLLLSGLKEDGIEATGIEAFDIVTKTRSRYRILVRHVDAVAAVDSVNRLQRMWRQ